MLQRDKTVIVIVAHGHVINKSNIRWKYVVENQTFYNLIHLY